MAFYPNRKSNNLASSISVLAITIGLVAGQSATQKSLAQTSTTPPPSGVTSINGVGSSTVNILFVGTGTTPPFAPKGSWFNTYGVGNPTTLNPPGPVNPSVTFRYASTGSGTGLTAFFTQTVPPASPGPTILAPISFAASDHPVVGTETVSGGPNNAGGTAADASKYVQVPVIGVGIALAYNRNGLTIPAAGLKLSRNTYLGILNGTITNWNAPQIKADNGGATIAVNLPIKVVRRSDDSGSTFLLSSHLKAAFGGSWVRGVGKKSIAQPASGIPNPLPSDTVVWPANFLSAPSCILSIPGEICYVDNATRLAKSLPAAILQNKAGNYIAISSTSIGQAFAGATDLDTNARRIKIQVSDPTNTTAYPIAGVTYMLFYDKYADVRIANGIKGFINWALGGSSIPSGYAPLPDTIKIPARNVVNTYVDTLLNP